MEKRDKLLLVAVLGAGGYLAYDNWDVIYERLGLAELSPGYVRAIELAKSAATFDRYRPNWDVLREREQRGELELPEKTGGWSAENLRGELYRVRCSFLINGESDYVTFNVDIGTGKVDELRGLPASPR